jgi:hypothetical protein
MSCDATYRPCVPAGSCACFALTHPVTLIGVDCLMAAPFCAVNAVCIRSVLLHRFPFAASAEYLSWGNVSSEVPTGASGIVRNVLLAAGSLEATLCPHPHSAHPHTDAATTTRSCSAHPPHLWSQAGLSEPVEQVVEAVRQVHRRVQRCRLGHRPIGHHNVGHHEPPAWRQTLADTPKQVGLARSVQVVHGTRRDDKLERSLGQRILEASESQLRTLTENRRSDLEHVLTRVNDDNSRPRVRLQA